MQLIALLLLLSIIPPDATVAQAVYHGSTPAHRDVRSFLSIAQTDSIDFIRWKLLMRGGQYDLSCHFGLSKAGTNGFINTREVAFSGAVLQEANYIILKQGDKTLHLMKINSNLFHLLDKKKAFLVGNGSYSYVLNIDAPLMSDQFNLQVKQAVDDNIMAFEGRTPCQELSRQLGLHKSAV